MSLGPLYFAAPTALLALLALPLLFVILRAAPPTPSHALFPPVRLLVGLRTEEEARRKAPLWLVLLRALMAALAIVGFARPSLAAPEAAQDAAGAGPTLIVLDDGWTSAPFWGEARAAAEQAVAEAEQSRQSVALITTAPTRGEPAAANVLSPAEARSRLARLEPSPLRPDRGRAEQSLARTRAQFGRAVWIADGLEDAASARLVAALQARASLRVELPSRSAYAVGAAGIGAGGVDVTVRRAGGGPASGAVAVETAEGRALGAAEFRFAPGATETTARASLPAEIAARAARVRLVGEQSAGGTRLIAGGAGRPLIGLVNPGAQNQPLLSELFYLERAMQPFAITRAGEIAPLLKQGARGLVVSDASRLAPADERSLSRWIEAGGLLIRFAGPRLANASDELLPVRLRLGSRTMGGAMAWEDAQRLQPFPSDSPFFGLDAPEDVRVRRQVLAEPGSAREARVWAALDDGTPVVTARARGNGLIVLFHVTAGPEWSDLPLSGLYVSLLERTVAFAGAGARAEGEAVGGSGPFRPERLLDGYGALVAPPPDAPTIDPAQFDKARAAPGSPPGLYARSGGPLASVHAVANDERLAPLRLPASVTSTSLSRSQTRPLAGWFLGGAVAALFADLLLSLLLAGRLPRPRLRRAAVAALLAAAVLRPHGAEAQAARRDPANEHFLAYVITGDARSDRIAKEGLEVLAETLRNRTAAEPAGAVGVDLARDDLSVYPMLYWRAPERPRPLSAAATANLDRYMRLGGMLFLDTHDAGVTHQGRGPAALMLEGVDAPPLEPVAADNVLTRSFYLLKSFPGRAATTRLFAETPAAASARDGVASLMVGDGDWAAMWAMPPTGAIASDPRQREMALRFGVNLVMVALTGNYKADLVHAQTLLQRQGEERE